LIKLLSFHEVWTAVQQD